MQWSRADPAHVRAVANAIVALAFCACEARGSRPSSQAAPRPPIHRPFFLEASISSRICALAKIIDNGVDLGFDVHIAPMRQR
jgi:hypothetical protein